MTWLLENAFGLALTVLYLGQAVVSAARHEPRTAALAALFAATTVLLFLWRPQP